MPEYTDRILELQQEFSALHLELELKGPRITFPTAQRIEAGIRAYGETRERQLTTMLPRIVAEPSASAEGHKRAWQTAMTQFGSQAFTHFTGLVKDEKGLLVHRFEQIAERESSFFHTLSALPLVEFLGQLREHSRRIEEEKRNLQKAWIEQSGQTERADADVAALRVQVLDSFRRAVIEARGWGAKVEGALMQAVTAWAAKEGSDPEPSVTSWAADSANTLLGPIHQLQRTNDEAVRAVTPKYSGKMTIHMMFGNTRAIAKDYLDKVNAEAIARQFFKVSAESVALAGAINKPGLKADGTKFVEKLVVGAREELNKFLVEWLVLYDAFKGKYFEEPTPQTLEILAESELFDRFWREVQALNLPGVFSEADAAIGRCEKMWFDNITPAQRAQIQALIKARAEHLKKTIRSMDMSLFDRAKLHYFDVPLQMIRDRIKNLPGFRK